MKIKKISIIALLGLMLTSCNSKSITLDKPSDTNLEFWITQKINSEDEFNKCTFLPGMFGGDMFLDSRYTATFDKNNNYTLPSKYVIYTVTSYPDYSDGNDTITRIEITDPSITFYNLSLKSSNDEIMHVMEQEGFKKGESNVKDELYFTKNNTGFTFTESEIYINAHVSNKNGIMF